MWIGDRAKRQKQGVHLSGFEGDFNQEAGQRIGRVDEVERLRGRISESDGRILWLTGQAGIGKSYIVARIAAELLDDPP